MGCRHAAVFKGTERKKSLVGGASLWVLAGRPAEEYKGAAAFLNFIAQPDMVQWWSTVTGYSRSPRPASKP